MRNITSLAATSGALAIGFGAFGAHALKAQISSLPDAAQRLGWWETAAHYHLVHAVALFALGLSRSTLDDRLCKLTALAWCTGMLIFCGSLYLMTLTGWRQLGAVTPVGGSAFILGWLIAAWAARRSTFRGIAF